MAKKISEWLQKPLYVYLFGLFFLIYRTAQYFPSFEISTFIIFFGVYCSITFLFISILQKTGVKKGAHLFILFVWIYILLFSELSTLFSTAFNLTLRVRYFGAICLIGFLILYFFQKKQLNISEDIFNKPVNFFLLILSFVVLINGIRIAQKEKQHEFAIQNTKAKINSKGAIKKDIIWILLDEYGAPACLKSELKFADFLVDSLKQKGFYVYDSMPSRNDITIFSICSLYNLDDTTSLPNFMYAANYLLQSVLVKQIKAAGYHFQSLDFLSIANREKFMPLPIFPYNYLDQLLYGKLATILTDKFTSITNNERFDTYNHKVIKKLLEETKVKKNAPQFIWAHLLIPHGPYCRDAKGNFLKNMIDYTEEKNIQAYLDYLTYCNNVVLNTINQIPDLKNKTIVISGDHGFRFSYLGVHNPIRKATFCAIYYPNMDTSEFKQIKYLQQLPLHLHY